MIPSTQCAKDFEILQEPCVYLPHVRKFIPVRRFQKGGLHFLQSRMPGAPGSSKSTVVRVA